MNTKFHLQATLSLIAATLAFASTAAQAHYLWIERDGSVAKVYFGEWQTDLRENDSGPLKAIQGEIAYDADRNPLEIERKNDYLLITKPGKGDVRVFDEVMHRGSKVVYDIKGGRIETKGVNNFELVPLEANGNRFTLMLDGKPLPKAELEVFGPPKWEKKLTTDDQGTITIDTPWKGQYVVRAEYDDDTGGDFEGKKFDKVLNVMILSFTVDQGIAWSGK